MIIFINGFMGAGKSTFGKKLAKKYNYSFVDLDEYIEKITDRSISELFEELGDERFRFTEQSALGYIFENNTDNIVISTGGGTPCFYDNMDFMNSKGITVYLEASAKMLLSRLINSQKERPLIKDKSSSELLEFIEKSLHEREQYYNKSKVKVNIKDISIEQVMTLVDKF